MAHGRCEKHWGFAIFHLAFAIQDAFLSILLVPGTVIAGIKAGAQRPLRLGHAGAALRQPLPKGPIPATTPRGPSRLAWGAGARHGPDLVPESR